LKEYDNINYNDEEKALETELELDEDVFEPLDEEGLDNVHLENFEPKEELEYEGAEITVDFIPSDENSIFPFSKKGADRIPKRDNENHTRNTKFKIYSEKDVRYWIQQYKHNKNYQNVQNH